MADSRESRIVADHLAICSSCSEEYRVAASLEAWAQRASNELVLPTTGQKSPVQMRAFVYAAAAIAAVGLAGSIVAWGLALREQNARLKAALDASSQTSPTAVSESADGAAFEKDRQIADLQARLNEALAPSVNTPIVDLMPRDALRGPSTEPAARVPSGASAVTFVITTPSAPVRGEHTLEIVDRSDTTVWRGHGLLPNEERSFTVTVPRALLPAVACRLRLYGPDTAGRRVVAEYVVQVEP